MPRRASVLPDPADEAAFRACRINWCGHPGSEEARLLHTDLLTLRRSDVVLSGLGTPATQVATSALTGDILLLRYSTTDDERLILVNLGRRTTLRMNDPLLAPASAQVQWTMMWCSERVVYGGTGVAPFRRKDSGSCKGTARGCFALSRSEPRRNDARIWPGQSFPLGAHFDGAGVNFSIFSEVAERVDFCLFDDDGTETAVRLPERTAFCWHGYVPGLRPGQRYGFRVNGPWEPEEGLRCNPSKLLLDPYARAIVGTSDTTPAIFGHVIARDGSATAEPNCGGQRAVRAALGGDRSGKDEVVASRFAAAASAARSVIYELHVKGFTKLRDDLPPEIRGTYAGLGASGDRSSICSSSASPPSS